MSTKKKPASKTAADKGPQPLLKLKFEKFPQNPVAVYFDKTERGVYAEFGFERYKSPSVAGLEQKIKAAIKNGVTPSPVWVPMILIGIDINHGRTSYKQALDLNFDVDIEREYFCIGKGGKMMSCGWEVHERSRNKEAHETSGAFSEMKPRALNAPIFKRSSSYHGGIGVDALIPYTEDLWRDIGEQVRELRAQAAGLIGHVIAGRLEVFTNFIFDFERSLKPQAKKPALRPAKPKVRPMPNRERRTDRELKPAATVDPRQPLLPLHKVAEGSLEPASGKPGKGVLPQVDFKMLDLVIDLPAGPVPAEMLEAAGFPDGSTAEKETDGDFMVTLPRKAGSSLVGHVQHIPRAEMQKLIRDRINGQRGAKPKEVKKASAKKKASGASPSTRRAPLHQAPNDRSIAKTSGGLERSDRTKEHLVVKYQGNQLTLGHGPLGNYLVEALRKTYPDIQSAYCLKDNRVQMSIRGQFEPKTISAELFEELINYPGGKAQQAQHGQRGGGVIGTLSPEWGNALREGAIAKLHEIAAAMRDGDPPLVLPDNVILAAGFPARAEGEINAPDAGDDIAIIVRVHKKAPQFFSVKQFEARITARMAPAEPQKAVSA
jgi:hypothetical protein